MSANRVRFDGYPGARRLLMNTTSLACPTCTLPMRQYGSALKCGSGHSFDLSAKGYANLLTDSCRNSLAPGDSHDMVAARRRFLDSGSYDVLGNALAGQVLKLGDEIRVLADAGCGEGAWTRGILKALPDPETIIYGMDISKEAIRYASGRSKRISWIVASLFHLPLSNCSVDCLMNVFAPSCDLEFARVLRKDGILVTAIPGRSHLSGLKNVLYEEPYENDEELPELPSFTLQDVTRVEGSLHLKGQENIRDLLSMTPYFWRTPKAGIEQLSRLSSLETPIEFLIAIHRKH
jgi:23S rRNA (guanine745-N1)-methyltransferase